MKITDDLAHNTKKAASSRRYSVSNHIDELTRTAAMAQEEEDLESTMADDLLQLHYPALKGNNYNIWKFNIT